jgi:hypothetical protein
VLFLTVLALGSLQGANAPDEPQWFVDRSVTLTPRPEPVPALKYRLLPLTPELKEGNAVPIYLRLLHERNDESRREWNEKPAAWNQLPLDQLPVGEIRKFLADNAYTMKQLELGARRTTAEWNYTLDAGNPIGILLPDAQGTRTYGGLLLLQARLEIAEGNYEAAAHTLQTGFALSRHVADGPFLINGLVANAIGSQFADALLEWVARADAPNLYWALTALPQPLIDLRKELEIDQRIFELQFPILADLKRERTPAEWDAALKQLRTEVERLRPITYEKGADNKNKLAPPGRAPTDPAAESPELPAARKYLVERLQLPAARVDAMPPAQVLLLHLAAVIDELRDDLFKGASLPVPQALPVLQAAEKRLQATPDTEATWIPRTLLSAIPRVVVSVSRLERQLAALRVIEAVRLHATAHDGHLPDKLADITEVPVPDDPGTGRPFDYRRETETATLIGPPLNVPVRPKHPVPKTALRFRLTIKSKG